MTHNEENNQSIPIQNGTHMLGLADKNIKTVTVTVFRMFKKLSRDM